MLIALMIINLFVLHGQKPALPMVVTIAWDANGGAAHDYAITMDGKLMGTVPLSPYNLKITSLGVHYIRVTARAPGYPDQVSNALVVRVTKDAIPLQPTQ